MKCKFNPNTTKYFWCWCKTHVVRVLYSWKSISRGHSLKPLINRKVRALCLTHQFLSYQPTYHLCNVLIHAKTCSRHRKEKLSHIMTSKTIVMTYVHERLHTIVLLLLLAFTAPVSSNCNILSANLTKT